MAWVVGVTIAVDADNVPEKVKAPGFVEVLARLVLQVAAGVGLKGVSAAGGGAAEAAASLDHDVSYNHHAYAHPRERNLSRDHPDP